MKIVFFGSAQSSIKILTALLAAGYEILAVITKEYSPIQSFAKGAGLNVLAPQKIAGAFIEQIKDLNAKAGVLFIYGKIIPKELISVFPKGILGVHPSLLPKYRGPSPISAAILDGAEKTGVTIYLLDEKIDHGPLLAQAEVPIQNTDTNFTLLEGCAKRGAEIIIEILPKYLRGEITPAPQDESATTYTSMLAKEDGRIDWQKDPIFIERAVRAYFPWPAAWTTLGELIKHLTGKESQRKGLERRVKILKTHLENGNLAIDELQIEGKSPLLFSSFEKGYLT